jgi:hypothetical protein
MGATVAQVIEDKGAWIIFPPEKILTPGERAMVSLGGLMGAWAKDPDVHIPTNLGRVGIKGIMLAEPSSPAVRNTQLVVDVLGMKTADLLGAVVSGVLDAAQETGLFGYPDNDNIAGLIRGTMTEVRIDLNLPSLMREVDRRIDARRH